MKEITVVLPAYNEEQDLPGLLKRIDDALALWANYRVLIVDDGSVDNTAKIAQDWARNYPVTLLQHERNMGLGAAIRTGLKASAELNGVIITMDADNSQGPELIGQMVEKIESGYDVVIASRFQKGSQEVGVPGYRVALSHLSSAVIRLLVRYPNARDFTCGFRAYRRSTIRSLIANYGDNFLRENGFSCMYEILLNCRRISASVAEVPLVLRYDLKQGASKMRVIPTASRYLITTIRGYLPLEKLEESASDRAFRNYALSSLFETAAEKRDQVADER